MGHYLEEATERAAREHAREQRDPRDKLDLNDVVHGHPVAEADLQTLRDQIVELRAAIQGVLSWHEWECDPENYEKEHDGWKPLFPWRRLHAAMRVGE